jgi:tetratricopeptide (TPR) repeat protein
MMLDGDMAPAEVLRPLAVASAARAIELNPDLAETNIAFADVKYRFEHDWEAADAAYQRALALAPHAVIVLNPYSRFLCAAGRLDEALHYALAGEQADPLSFEMAASVGVTHYYRREFDDALRYQQRAAELSPNYGPAYFSMGRVHSARGDFSQAVEHIQKAMTLVGEPPAYQAELARNLFLGGRQYSAEQILGRLLLNARNAETGVSYEGIGYVYAALGDLDRAFEWLNRSLDHYFSRLLFIKVDPRADPLRNDPRYAALVRRLGLKP